jgi:hypothetical protein
LTVADDGCAKDRDQAPEVLEAIEDLTAIFHGHFTSRYDHRGDDYGVDVPLRRAGG